MTVNALAKALRLPTPQINDVVRGWIVPRRVVYES
jgi:hypothetical protein